MAGPQVEVDILANDRSVTRALSNIQGELTNIQRALGTRMSSEFRRVTTETGRTARSMRQVRINANDMRQSFQRAGAAGTQATTSLQQSIRSLVQTQQASIRQLSQSRLADSQSLNHLRDQQRRLVEFEARVGRERTQIASNPALRRAREAELAALRTGVTNASREIGTQFNLLAREEEASARRSAAASRERTASIRAGASANTAAMQQETTAIRQQGRIREREIQASARRFVAVWQTVSRQWFAIQRAMVTAAQNTARAIATAFAGLGRSVSAGLRGVQAGMSRMVGVFQRSDRQMAGSLGPAMAQREGILRRSLGRQTRVVQDQTTRQVRAVRQGQAAMVGAATPPTARVGGFGGIRFLLGGFGSIAAFRLLADGIRGASQELVNFDSELLRTDAIFGDFGDTIVQATDDATSRLGLTRAEALDAMNQFGVFLRNFGFAGDELADFSKSFADMGAEIAGFNNVPIIEAQQAIESAFAGESEPLRRFGIDTRVARVEQHALAEGIINTGEELDDYTRALTIHSLIQEEMGAAAGHTERSMVLLAAQMRVFRAEMVSTFASMGEFAIPTLTRLTEVANVGFRNLRLLIRGQTDANNEISSSMQRAREGIIGFAQAMAGFIGLRTIPRLFSRIGGALRFLITPFRVAALAVGGLGSVFRLMMDGSPEFAASIDRIRNVLSDFGGTLQPLVDRVRDFVTEIAAPALGSAIEFAADRLEDFAQFLATNLEPALETVSSFITGTIIPAIGDFASAVGDVLGPPFREVAGFVTGTVLPALSDFWEVIRNEVIPTISDAASQLVGNLGPAFETVRDAVVDLATSIDPVVAAGAGGGIIGLLAGFRLGGPVIGGALAGIGALIGAFPELRGAIGGVGQAIGDLFTGSGDFGDLGSAFQELGGVIADLAGRAIDNLSELGGQLTDAISGWFDDVDFGAIVGSALSAIRRVGFIVGNILTDPRVILGVAATVGGLAVAALTFVRGFAEALIDNLGELGSILAPHLGDALGDAADAAGGFIADRFGRLATLIGETIFDPATLVDALNPAALSSRIVAALSGLPQAIGEALFDSRIILGILGAVLAAGAIRRAIGHIVGVFRTSGAQAGQQMAIHTRIGFTQGMAGMGTAVRGALTRQMGLRRALTLAATNARGAASAAGQRLGNSLVTGIGAAMSGFAAGQADTGAGQAFGLAGVAGSIAAGFAVGGPIGAAVAGLAGAVGLHFGSMSADAEEAAASVDQYTQAIVGAREAGDDLGTSLGTRVFGRLQDTAPDAADIIRDLDLDLGDLGDSFFAINEAAGDFDPGSDLWFAAASDELGQLGDALGLAGPDMENFIGLLGSDLTFSGLGAGREAVVQFADALGIEFEDARALIQALQDEFPNLASAISDADAAEWAKGMDEDIRAAIRAVDDMRQSMADLAAVKIENLRESISGVEDEIESLESRAETTRAAFERMFEGIRLGGSTMAQDTLISQADVFSSVEAAANQLNEIPNLVDIDLGDSVTAPNEAQLTEAIGPFRRNLVDSVQSTIESGVELGWSSTRVENAVSGFTDGLRRQIRSDDSIGGPARQQLLAVVEEVEGLDIQKAVNLLLDEQELNAQIERLGNKLERLSDNLEVQIDLQQALSTIESLDLPPVEGLVELLPHLEPSQVNRVIESFTPEQRVELRAILREEGIEVEGLDSSVLGLDPLNLPWQYSETPSGELDVRSLSPIPVPWQLADEPEPATGGGMPFQANFGGVEVSTGGAAAAASNIADALSGAIEDVSVAASIQFMVNDSMSGISAPDATGIGSSISSSVSSGISSSAGQVTATLLTLISGLTIVLVGAASQATQGGAAFVTSFAIGITSQSGVASNAGSQIAQAALAPLLAAVGVAIAYGANVGSGFAGGVAGQSGAAASAGSSLGSSAAGAVQGYYGVFYSAGANAGSGFSAGLRAAASSAASAAISIANSAVAATRAILAISSPSRVFRQMGQEVGQGFVTGMESSRPFVQRGFRNTWGRMLTSWEERVQHSVEAIQNSFESLSSTQFGALTDFGAALDEMRQAARDFEGASGSRGLIGTRSERGRENRSIISRQVDAAQEILTNLVEAGASSDRIVRRFQEMRRDIVVTARQSGVSANAINNVLQALNFTMGDLREAFGAQRVSPLTQFESEMESFLENNVGVPFERVVRDIAQMFRSIGVPVGGELRNQIESFVREFRHDPVRRFGNAVERAADQAEAASETRRARNRLDTLLPGLDRFESDIEAFVDASSGRNLHVVVRDLRDMLQSLGVAVGPQEYKDLRQFVQHLRGNSVLRFNRSVDRATEALEEQRERQRALNRPGELVAEQERFGNVISTFAEQAHEAGLSWQQAGRFVVNEMRAIGIQLSRAEAQDIIDFTRNSLFNREEQMRRALDGIIEDLTAADTFTDNFSSQLDRIIEHFADTPNRIEDEIRAALRHAGLGDEAGQFANEINAYIERILDDPARKLDEYLDKLLDQEPEEFNVPTVTANVYPQFGDPEAIALATANQIASQVRGG